METRRIVTYYMKEKGKLGGLRLVDKITDYLIDNKKVYIHGFYRIYDSEEVKGQREHEKGRFIDLSGRKPCIEILSWLSEYRGKNAVKICLKMPGEIYG